MEICNVHQNSSYVQCLSKLLAIYHHQLFSTLRPRVLFSLNMHNGSRQQLAVFFLFKKMVKEETNSYWATVTYTLFFYDGYTGYCCSGGLQNPMWSRVTGLCQGFTMWPTAMLPSSIAARYYFATRFFIQYKKYSILYLWKKYLGIHIQAVIAPTWNLTAFPLLWRLGE